MPLRNFVLPDLGVLITICIGYVTREEFNAAFQESERRPGFDSDFKHLIDCSAAAHVELKHEDLSSLNNGIGIFSSRGKRAMVACPGSALHSIASMFEATANTPRIRVFDSLFDAVRWLGLEVTILEVAVNRASNMQIHNMRTILTVEKHAGANLHPMKTLRQKGNWA